MNKTIELLKKIDSINTGDILNKMEIWAEAESCLHNLPDTAWNELEGYADDQLEDWNIYAKIYIWSALLDKTKANKWLQKILESMLNSELPAEELLFVRNQLSNWIFTNNSISSPICSEMMHILSERIRSIYRNMVVLPKKKIPVTERNKDFVLVLAGQMLSLMHGPTKTALDRCKVLIEEMGKEVLLINTATVCSPVGKIPMYRIMTGNYLPELCSLEIWEYKGCSIPFVQMELGLDWFQNLIDLVVENKPYQIVSIGSDLVTDFCSEIVDTMAISLCPSALMDTHANFQQIGRPLLPEDNSFLRLCGIKKETVISGIFTSDLKPQETVLHRQDLNIPENRFTAVIVGGRLDEEITDEFLIMLNNLVTQRNIFLLFLGRFEQGYERIKKDYPCIAANSLYPGMVGDILAYMDLCDLYLNPARRGGGTSSVEALSKGVPVITTRFGDVYTNVSELFAVSDYTEMKQMALRYTDDQAFYEKQRKNALQRAEIMLDTTHAFMDIMDDFERRMTKNGKF